MTISLKLCWQDDVSVSETEGTAVISGPQSRLTLPRVSPAVLTALHRLKPPGETHQQLEAAVLANGNMESLARWFYHLGQFQQRGLIRRALHSEAGHFATLSTVSSSTRSSNHRSKASRSTDGNSHEPSNALYQLSRFAYLRRDGQQMLLESPLSHSRLVLHDPRAAMVIAALSTGCTLQELAGRIISIPADNIAALVLLLEEAGMLEVSHPADQSKGSAEFDSWEFHDLLFHSRSRRGRSNAPFGATYRLVDQPLPPALRPSDGEGWIDLSRPDLDRLEREDPPFAYVQNHRRSIRQYAAEPIKVEQLGEILYRVGRVTETRKSKASGPTTTFDFAGRPYPSGGALYELEFYPVIGVCQGLERGMYAYDPLQHRLRLIAGDNSDVKSLVDDAAMSAGIEPATVQVLLVLASQFRRIAWKYESIAYALTLKHVGVVYQTLYLAATAMGLAPCALGCGDSDLFARAAGTQYHVESSVGEFLLGSRT
nr:hypothetical protein Hi04_10k_c5016_00042 [uncultured bacterium]